MANRICGSWSGPKPEVLQLRRGPDMIRFRMDSENSNHGYLDCFVLSNEPFQPQGILKPDAMAEAMRQAAQENEGWIPFNPAEDSFQESAGLDLRSLNEQVAGEHGFIGVKDGEFIHTEHRSTGAILGGQRTVEQGSREFAAGSSPAGQTWREHGPRARRLLRQQRQCQNGRACGMPKTLSRR